MEVIDLRHSGAVELAAGGTAVVERRDTLRRGLIALARQLRAERRKPADDTDRRALLALEEEEIAEQRRLGA